MSDILDTDTFSDALKKDMILSEAYSFQKLKRTDPDLQDSDITVSEISSNLRLVVEEGIGLCKELDEDNLIQLSRATIGRGGERDVYVTSQGRLHLERMSNDTLAKIVGHRASLEIDLVEVSQFAPASDSLILTSASVLSSIKDYRESIERNNKLIVDHPDHHAELLAFLDRLHSALLELINTLPDTSDKPIEEVDAVKGWVKQYWSGQLQADIEKYKSPDFWSAKTLPLGIPLGLGAIGALIGGGSIGLAGVVVGGLITGDEKASVAIQKIQKALGSESNEPEK